MKFEIRISELIPKILLEQRRLYKIRHCLTGHIQILHIFWPKMTFVSLTFKIEIFQFYN